MTAPSRTAAGIGYVLLMAACFASLDTSAKWLGQGLPVLVVLWARYAIQGVAMGVWLGVRAARGRGSLFRTLHPRFQALRASLLLATSALMFFGIQHMPVAEFTAVGMLTPVLVSVLAAVFLHERLSPLRAAMVTGGFLGALIVVRPGSGLFGWVALVPLLLAFVNACFQLVTRRMAGLEHPLTTHFYTGLLGALFVTLVLALSPVDATSALAGASPRQWAVLLLAGALGTVGHLCLILAVARAPMAVLMPFTYVQIAFASFTGWVAFGHVPDRWALAGMAVVAACGAASVWLNLRESANARRIAPTDAAPLAD